MWDSIFCQVPLGAGLGATFPADCVPCGSSPSAIASPFCDQDTYSAEACNILFAKGGSLKAETTEGSLGALQIDDQRESLPQRLNDGFIGPLLRVGPEDVEH